MEGRYEREREAAQENIREKYRMSESNGVFIICDLI